MDALEQTIAALGNPLSVASLNDRHTGPVVLARWAHDKADVSVDPNDTLRVLFSVSGVQNVGYMRHGRIVRATGKAGDVGILSPAFARTIVEGPADIVQVFLGAMSLVMPVVASLQKARSRQRTATC